MDKLTTSEKIENISREQPQFLVCRTQEGIEPDKRRFLIKFPNNLKYYSKTYDSVVNKAHNALFPPIPDSIGGWDHNGNSWKCSNDDEMISIVHDGGKYRLRSKGGEVIIYKENIEGLNVLVNENPVLCRPNIKRESKVTLDDIKKR